MYRAVLLAVAAAAILGSCSHRADDRHEHPPENASRLTTTGTSGLPDGEDFDSIISYAGDARVATIVPREIYDGYDWEPPEGANQAASAPQCSKFEPGMEELRARAAENEAVEVLIAVVPPASVPRFPMWNTHEDRDSPANLAIATERLALFETVQSNRFESQAPVVSVIRSLGGEVLEQHALGNTIRALVPVMQLDTVANLAEVLSISPRWSSDVPAAADSNPNNDPLDAISVALLHYVWILDEGAPGRRPSRGAHWLA